MARRHLGNWLANVAAGLRRAAVAVVSVMIGDCETGEVRDMAETSDSRDRLSALPCGSNPGPRWYCVLAHWRTEQVALNNLIAQGFRAFLPLHYVQRPSGDVGVVSMFPPYLFVEFDMAADRWRRIHSTRGVRQLFSTSAERPTPVPPGVVEKLISRAGPEGIIGARPETDLPPLPEGAAAVVLTGPLADLSGVCRWSTRKRVGLLLQIMGGADVEVTVPRASVRAV